MEIINEIITDLTKTNGNLESALLKTKVLAYKLDNKTLSNWVTQEINGYDDSKSLPEYRIIKSWVYGVITNGFTRYTNHQIPLMHLESSLRESLTQAKLTNGIASLEDMASKASSTMDHVESPIPVDAAQALLNYNSPLEGGYIIESASKRIPLNLVKEIISTIRSKLLDFVLELDKQIGDKPITEQVKKTVEGIFTATITGNNNVFLVGDNNIQKVNIKIKEQNFQQLSDYLQQQGLTKLDIQNLKSVIDTEKPDANNKKFGSKVNAWIVSMVGKAATGGWDMAIGAAGSLLADAISKYYGWS